MEANYKLHNFARSTAEERKSIAVGKVFVAIFKDRENVTELPLKRYVRN